MKRIIDNLTKEEIKFSKEDLPIMIHGKEHSGASLLSITIAALFHSSGKKMCIFTAYDMAKDEFLKQVQDREKVFCLEDDKNISESFKFQTIIVKSGDIELFEKFIRYSSFDKDRIIFIKNIETINTQLFKLVQPYSFMVSGDLQFNLVQQDFKNFTYNTKIFLTPMFGEVVPPLEKYQAFMKNNLSEKIIVVV